MDFQTLSAARYSLRKFSPAPVEEEKLALILESGRNAPTAHNNQPQRIFVLQSPEALEKADACTSMHFHAPMTLVVAYDPEAAWKREHDGKNHGEIDAAIAVTQMMLQAADLGLGTTYVGMFEPEKLLEAFPEMAGLMPIAMLPLGYPAENARPSRLHGDRIPTEEMVTYL
jgi:nitroreductase